MTTVTELLPPPFAWCDIPPGAVTLEAEEDPGGLQGGVHEVGAFAIAQHPITNAQYQVFLDDGFSDPTWWDFLPQAATWREQHPTPKPTAFPGDRLPRTNINWYNAMAFCRWLSARTGQTIVLPTEPQWQRAAQGDDGRVFPWGYEFDQRRCNYSGIAGPPMPVTDYPDGESPYGVMNMAGNVWDWTLEETGNPDSKYRIVRGGSFGTFAGFCRIGFRLRALPATESSGFGFRLVRL